MNDIKEIRDNFSCFTDYDALFFDAPGGTQVPYRVVNAMNAYTYHSNSNLGGSFRTSRQTGEAVDEAREKVANFINAKSPNEIVFGHNMTTMTFSFSRAISRTWNEGDEIIVSTLDHNANVATWEQAAFDRGCGVNYFHHEDDGTFKEEKLRKLLCERISLGKKVRMLAITMASNAIGTIIDNMSGLITAAHDNDCLVYVDAVHYAPHGKIDVQELDCDFLVCSAYKFFGPRVGIVYGKEKFIDGEDYETEWDKTEVSRDWQKGFRPYKVATSSNIGPSRWETGSQSFDCIAGLSACIDYMEEVGIDKIVEIERELTVHFLEKLKERPNITLYGSQEVENRTPTFAITVEGKTAQEVSEYLGELGIFTWHGYFYALGIEKRLRIKGGVVRIGLVHYHTTEDIDRLFDTLDNI
jgi:cysteine desulfurase family protein (TIGR01976 family)